MKMFQGHVWQSSSKTWSIVHRWFYPANMAKLPSFICFPPKKAHVFPCVFSLRKTNQCFPMFQRFASGTMEKYRNDDQSIVFRSIFSVSPCDVPNLSMSFPRGSRSQLPSLCQDLARRGGPAWVYIGSSPCKMAVSENRVAPIIAQPLGLGT